MNKDDIRKFLVENLHDKEMFLKYNNLLEKLDTMEFLQIITPPFKPKTLYEVYPLLQKPIEDKEYDFSGASIYNKNMFFFLNVDLDEFNFSSNFVFIIDFNISDMTKNQDVPIFYMSDQYYPSYYFLNKETTNCINTDHKGPILNKISLDYANTNRMLLKDNYIVELAKVQSGHDVDFHPYLTYENHTNNYQRFLLAKFNNVIILFTLKTDGFVYDKVNLTPLLNLYLENINFKSIGLILYTSPITSNTYKFSCSIEQPNEELLKSINLDIFN